jgi:hypothetical protein
MLEEHHLITIKKTKPNNTPQDTIGREARVAIIFHQKPSTLP